MAGTFDYGAAWKRIRGFVSFTADPRNLTPSQKKQIRAYDKTAAALIRRGVHVYRSRKASNLQAVQSFAQHPPGFPRFSVAFVPVADPSSSTRIRVNKRGTVHVVSQGIARNVYLFAQFERYPGERLTDTLGVVRRILAVDRRSRAFSRICGEHEESGTWPRDAELIAQRCQEYIENYGNHKRWFTGLIGYNFIAQEDFAAYRKARGLAERKRKARRRKKRNDKSDR